MRTAACVTMLLLGAAAITRAAPTVVTVHAARPRQEFQGMGCGAIFYEAHITSLGEHGRTNEQEQLYDDLFTRVRTGVLQLMIRHDHEPANDNDDPYLPAFDERHFAWCRHPLLIAAAAKRRNPAMKLHAVLYTPPPWMKTNHDPGGGGKDKATLREGLELELGEFVWAFLDHMRRGGQPIDYLSLANECDWPHSQPSYFLDPERCARVHAAVAGYLREMERRHPETPRPQLVAPNTLSAVDCASRYLPPLLAQAGGEVDVIGCHDYDRRGHRWAALRALAGTRPLWQTESCFNGHDPSPGLIRSATEHWLNMTEAFNDGVNVWMAYDWVYPPREGGEALIHLDWGQGYRKTKIYHAFRQWCVPLEPGMRVVETEAAGACASGIAQAGVKASAFRRGDGSRLVVHVGAIQDAPAELEVRVDGGFRAAAGAAWRTGVDEDCASLGPVALDGNAFRTNLAGRAMMTLVFDGSIGRDARHEK